MERPPHPQEDPWSLREKAEERHIEDTPTDPVASGHTRTPRWGHVPGGAPCCACRKGLMGGWGSGDFGARASMCGWAGDTLDKSIISKYLKGRVEPSTDG